MLYNVTEKALLRRTWQTSWRRQHILKVEEKFTKVKHTRVFPKEQTVCRGPEEGRIREETGPELVGPSGGLLSRTVRKPMWKVWLESGAVGVVCGAVEQLGAAVAKTATAHDGADQRDFWGFKQQMGMAA